MAACANYRGRFPAIIIIVCDVSSRTGGCLLLGRPRYASVLGWLRSFLLKFSRRDKGCFTRCRSAEMVVYCSVPQCNTYHGETGASFYYYPRDRKVRKEWLTKLKMGKTNSKSCRVRSKHFDESDFVYPWFTQFRTNACKQLQSRANSLPWTEASVSASSIPPQRQRARAQLSPHALLNANLTLLD